MTSDIPQKRRRDAVATRQAILDSAREAFARLGYDGAGVREIAAGAGVTAMLVNRYFGSKEGLFAEVLVASMESTSVVLPEILKQPLSGERIATALLNITQAGETPLEGFQIMLRSAGSARAAEIGREQIEKFHVKAISSTFNGSMTKQRAAVLLALISGIQVMRQMIGLKALAETDTKKLASIIGPLIEQLAKTPDSK